MKNVLQTGLLLALCSTWLANPGEAEAGRWVWRTQGIHSGWYYEPDWSDYSYLSSPATPPGAGFDRRLFAYTAGEFHKLDGNRWVERRYAGPDSQFVETGRTPEFVELYDHARDLFVRLRNDHGEWLRRDINMWVPWPGSAGRWR
jgi:hypothetical protein